MRKLHLPILNEDQAPRIEPRRTKIRVEPHEETIQIWANLLAQLKIGPDQKIAELCPGNDPKIEKALSRIDFRGKLVIIDKSERRMNEFVDSREGKFGLEQVISDIENAAYGGYGAVVANHPVDDLAVGIYASATGTSYDEIYSRSRKSPDYSRSVWRAIAQREEIARRIIEIFTKIADQIDPATAIAIAQYESKYERTQMGEEREFCKKTLIKIREELAKKGLVDLGEIAEEITGNSRNYQQGDWICLKKPGEKEEFRLIGVKVTEACNLACIHCAAAPLHSDSRITAEQARQIAQKIPKKCNIDLTGGEPFAHKELPQIIAAFAGHNRLSVTSNGTVFREEVLDAIKNAGARLKISIHGIDEIHDGITAVNGSFARTVRTIARAVERGVRIVIQTNFNDRNIECAKKVVELAAKLGVDEIKAFPLIKQGDAANSGLSGISEEDLGEKLADLRNHGDLIGWGGAIRSIRWPNEGQYVLIETDGRVTANPTRDGGSQVIGNIFGEEIGQIWKKYPYKEAHKGRYL